MSVEILRDKSASLDVRLAAAQLAGEIEEINDATADALMAILRDRSEAEELRGTAAIALGPVLEQCDIEGFEDADDELFAPPISEATFHEIQKALRDVYGDAGDAKLVRRRALEAAVRASADWQSEAVRSAHDGGDPEWKLTAIFAMQYVPGFDREILEALKSGDEETRFEAIRAAGAREVHAAWPAVKRILVDQSADLDLRLAAIEAALGVGGDAAKDVLGKLSNSENEEISEAAADALSFDDEYVDEEDEEEA